MWVSNVLDSVVHVLDKLRICLRRVCLLCVVQVSRLVDCVGILHEGLTWLCLTTIGAEDTLHRWVACEFPTLMRVLIRILLPIRHRHHLTFALTLHHTHRPWSSLPRLHHLLVVLVFELSKVVCVLLLKSRST